MISFKAGLGLCHNYDYSSTALTMYLPFAGTTAEKDLFRNKLP